MHHDYYKERTFNLTLTKIMYAATSVKRQKVSRETARPMENLEIFQGIGRIEYKPESSFTCEDQAIFRYYNGTERVHGRLMEEWIRGAVYYSNYIGCYSQTNSIQKAYNENSHSMELTKKNIRTMFEMCIKLGIKFWTGYLEDLIPEGDTLEEMQTNCEQLTELLNEYQLKTGIKPLWIGLHFKHNRYNGGAATNSDANVLNYACYQAKIALDIAHKLSAENFLLNASCEGYDNIMNADINKEMKHYARFLKMIIEYRDKISFHGQLLLDHARPTHRNFNYYANNAFDLMLFIKNFSFERYYKVNVIPGHEFNMANAYGCAGCIKIEKINDVGNITLMLRSIIEKGGLGQCGITFNMPQFNHSYTEPKEVIESYVNALDVFGKSLRLAIKLINDAQINKLLQPRYASYQAGWGAKFLSCDGNLADSEEFAKRLQEANTQCSSAKSNHWFVVLQRYVDTINHHTK